MFFVRGKKLQFVERARLQVSAARHPVEPLPACLYPVAVGIGIEVCVNGIGIRHIDTRYVEGIGSEERSVNADVPLVHGIQTLCVFADTVVEQGVPQQQLLILACDAVHFGVWKTNEKRRLTIHTVMITTSPFRNRRYMRRRSGSRTSSYVSVSGLNLYSFPGIRQYPPLKNRVEYSRSIWQTGYTKLGDFA